MTPDAALLLTLCVLGSDASDDADAYQPAQKEVPPDEALAQPADAFRTPVDALSERLIGSTSRAVRFDWRRSPVGFGVTAAELLERNNFGTTRLGAGARRAFGDFMGDVAVNYVWSWSTPSSDLLALTPYRQAGRPSRFEVDLNVGYAIAEGVVTPATNWVPPAEVVLSATAGLRYVVYPEGFAGMSLQDAAFALASPQLSATEIANLEDSRLPGMQVDLARTNVLAGFTVDVYLQPGVYLTPRLLVNLPFAGFVNGSQLGFWWETSVALGFAL